MNLLFKQKNIQYSHKISNICHFNKYKEIKQYSNKKLFIHTSQNT